MSTETTARVERVEYDIAFGNETDDDWTTNLNHVERELAYINARIAEGAPGYTEVEYPRPIRIVQRTVTIATTTSAWTDL